MIDVTEAQSLFPGPLRQTRLVLDNHARILYIRGNMTTAVPLTEARNRFSQLVEEASQLFARFTITRKGKPEAVLISKEEYDALIDTLEILANKETMRSLRRAKEDIKKGRVRPLEDVVKELKLDV